MRKNDFNMKKERAAWMDDEIAYLADQLRSGNSVAFVGTGVSLSYKDKFSGRTWAGIPPASALVELLSKKQSRISQTMSFPGASMLIEKNASRFELENFLLTHFDRPTLEPLPAHVILANLPFLTYITTNYDTLLERALVNHNRKPIPVISDKDVSRIRPGHVPVIKMYGCVTRPETMIVDNDENCPINKNFPLLAALVKTQLANKVLIFLGFDLNDIIFPREFDRIKAELGAYMPKCYAIVNNASREQRSLWNTKGVQIIESDLTNFLRMLLKAGSEAEGYAVYHPSEDWYKNVFFESLQPIITLPSETLIIDAFLSHLLVELRSPHFLLEEVLIRSKNAASLLFMQRKNFKAFSRISNDIIKQMRHQCSTKEEAEVVMQDLLGKLQQVSQNIKSKGADYIERGDNILLFSQSTRVIELIRGVPRGIQDTCQLYISECRPKSPLPFQDAISICENLIETGYKITLIPDAAVGNLIAQRQVSKVLIGAHAVLLREGKPYAFVNTCGSELLSLATHKYNVPMFVVAEQNKLEKSSGKTEKEFISYQQEEDLFDTVTPAVSDIKSAGIHINFLNIGYDLCKFRENIKLIKE